MSIMSSVMSSIMIAIVPHVYNGCYGCYGCDDSCVQWMLCYAMLCYDVYVNAARQRVICMYVYMYVCLWMYVCMSKMKICILR